MIKNSIFTLLSIFILIRISSKSILFIWICLELNLILFISLNNKLNNFIVNSIFKYYVIQRISRSIILMSLIILKNNFNKSFIDTFTVLAIWIKLGFFPFNRWFFQISENISWILWLLLNTIQKLTPIWLVTLINIEAKYMYILIINNSLFRAIEIFNQNSLRWIINCSSLNHFSWMLLRIFSFKNLWEFYFITYTALIYNLINFIKKNNWNSIINFINNKNLKINLIFRVILFNFIGIPPFLNFLFKIIIILNSHSVTILIFISIINLIIIIIYIKYIVSLTSNFLKNKIKKINFLYFNNLVNSIYLFILFIYII